MLWRRRRDAATTRAVAAVSILDRPILINDQPTTLREVDRAAQLAIEEETTPWEVGGAMCQRYLISRLVAQDKAVRGLLVKWQKDRLQYPLDDAQASAAFLAVKACEEELAKEWEESG